MDTRQEILWFADNIIRHSGFNGFSYKDISSILELRNAAIHYHFRSKSQLGLGVIWAEIGRIRAFRKATPLSGEDQLKMIIDVFRRNSSQGEGIPCLVGALLPDFENFEPEMQEGLRKLCSVIQEWVSEVLEDARKQGKIRFEGSAEDRAFLMLSTLSMSLLFRRALGEKIFQRMTDQLLQDLGTSWRMNDVPLNYGALDETPFSFSFT